MAERQGSLRRTGISCVFVFLVGLLLAAWGVWEGFLFPGGYQTRLMMILYLGAFAAVGGAALAGLLVLVARLRPAGSRKWLRIATAVVLFLAIFAGPVRAIVQYARLSTAEPRFEAALRDLRVPESFTELDNPPATLGPYRPDWPYASRSWRVPPETQACDKMRRALSSWLAAPIEKNPAHINAECGFDSGFGVGHVHGTVITDDGRRFAFVEIDAAQPPPT